MFDVVVSFFRRDPRNVHLIHSLSFCLSLLRGLCPEVSKIVVSDGSPQPGDDVRKTCADFRADYFHAGQELTFAATYNLGSEICRAEWICLMANDVFVKHYTFTRIKSFIESRAEPDRIGAIIPYLSSSDLSIQEATVAGMNYVSPLMTINLNVFKKSTFDAINRVPESFSGCYNDIVLSYKLKSAGKDIYLVKSYAAHYGRLTTSTNSTVRFQADKDLFARTYPELFLPGSIWSLNLGCFCNDSTFLTTFATAMAIVDDAARMSRIEKLMATPPFLRLLDD
jgi:GT2 family glycosyltransferase